MQPSNLIIQPTHLTVLVGKLKDLVGYLALIATIGILSFIAWHCFDGNAESLYALCLIPLAYSELKTRAQAFIAFFVYYGVGTSDLIHACNQFFNAPPQISVLIWVAWCAVLATPYAITFSKKGNFYAYPLAIVIATLPPLGLLGWVSPVIVAGNILPGAGVFGLILILCAFGIISNKKTSVFQACIWSAILAIVFLINNIEDSPLSDEAYIKEQPASTWVSIDTYLGRLNGSPSEDQSIYLKLSDVAENKIKSGAKVVVLPEQILGNWSDKKEYWWSTTERLAQKYHAVILAGANTPYSKTEYDDAVVAFGLGGDNRYFHFARMPMPGGNYNPLADLSARLHLFNSGVHRIYGENVSFSICYEDFLVWPSMVSSLFSDSKPTRIISMANNWFNDGNDATKIQKISIQSTARLYGWSLTRAVNFENRG